MSEQSSELPADFVPPSGAGSMQIRPQGTNMPGYSPHRDFAYIHIETFESAKRNIEREYWPELYDACERLYHDIHDMTAGQHRTFHEALVQACDVYAEYLRRTCEDPRETVDQLLTRVGWDKCHVAARLLWCAMLGAVTTGQIFMGHRDITPLGMDPLEVLEVCRQQIGRVRAVTNRKAWPEESARELKKVVRQCREAGLSFDDIITLVNDVRLDR